MGLKKRLIFIVAAMALISASISAYAAETADVIRTKYKIACAAYEVQVAVTTYNKALASYKGGNYLAAATLNGAFEDLSNKLTVLSTYATTIEPYAVTSTAMAGSMAEQYSTNANLYAQFKTLQLSLPKLKDSLGVASSNAAMLQTIAYGVATAAMQGSTHLEPQPSRTTYIDPKTSTGVVYNYTSTAGVYAIVSDAASTPFASNAKTLAMAGGYTEAVAQAQANYIKGRIIESAKSRIKIKAGKDAIAILNKDAAYEAAYAVAEIAVSLLPANSTEAYKQQVYADAFGTTVSAALSALINCAPAGKVYNGNGAILAGQAPDLLTLIANSLKFGTSDIYDVLAYYSVLNSGLNTSKSRYLEDTIKDLKDFIGQ